LPRSGGVFIAAAAQQPDTAVKPAASGFKAKFKEKRAKFSAG